jgi:hypothetical protein
VVLQGGVSQNVQSGILTCKKAVNHGDTAGTAKNQNNNESYGKKQGFRFFLFFAVSALSAVSPWFK